MHPRLVEVIDVATAARAELLATVAPLDVETLSRRPSPDAWSPAEILEHLRIVEGGVARLFRKMLPAARANGLGAETETSSVRHLLDDRHELWSDRKIEAPEFVRPVTADAATVRAGLEESRAALLAAIAEADGLAIGEIVFPHAVLGPLNLYEWVLFVGLHELRHLRQIRRGLESAAPAAPASLAP